MRIDAASLRARERRLHFLIIIAIGLNLPFTCAAAPSEPMSDLDAWGAVKLMGVGVNIGNTLENTAHWETGWGNPRITKAYVESLAKLGFKTVRLPVAWDTYARDGHIDPSKLERVGEVVDWITAAGMFCVVNIHWDGGWIDSSDKKKFAHTFATFSPDAGRKYRSYWSQIASHFSGKNERLIFEALNEETNFEGQGSMKNAYATLAHVNQLFIDTVRATGGNNPRRLLVITGYSTDIEKTTSADYLLPQDSAPHRLLLSVHYYTPWPFAGMSEDASWGRMRPTWGTPADLAELNRLFDSLEKFCAKHDLPAFIGEFGVTGSKETPSRIRWMSAVAQAALARKMVPVLWDTGGDISRRPPYSPSAALQEVLARLPR
jgi:endoglucanase